MSHSSLFGCTALAAAWPLQHKTGPDGDPRQQRDSYPKSSVPAQTASKRARVELPQLTELGDGNWRLSGGWRLQEVRKVAGSLAELSLPGFDSSKWYQATVPGTILTTLVDEGVYPEPTYGLNNLVIPEQLNTLDYWYRTEFTLPADLRGKTLTLTFNGINYSAEIWLNGKPLGEIKGAFKRGIFDLTALAQFDQPNALAVRLSPTPHPGIPHEQSLAAGAGPNGGSMCYDGPTFFCTEGWDWIPGIRDRATGIWQDVVLHASGPIAIQDVQVKTDLPLPDLSTATVTITTPVENRSSVSQKFTMRAEFEGVSVEQPVALAAGSKTEVLFDVSKFPELQLKQPRLWWPNGYGKPELYHLKLTVLDEQKRVTESKSLRFGIREVSYELSAFDFAGKVSRFEFSPTSSGERWIIDNRHQAIKESSPTNWIPSLAPDAEKSAALTPISDTAVKNLVVKVNGCRILVKGGNWGLDEALKRCERERLEPFFRLHREAHLTMVRNWCGQSTEEVFFDLADEYGLMVWNEFWLTTQDYNQEPGDMKLFLDNTEDSIKRYRNHPSIVLWCGRNEGVPPPVLNEGIDALLRKHDGTRHYLPSSNMVSLLNSGPWNHTEPVEYFTEIALGFSTEVGLPCVPTAEAIRAMMPVADQWPISDTWAYHDWHQTGNGAVQGFMKDLAEQYGEGTGLEDFCRKAQMLNYVGHRALFEGLNARLWKPSSGRLMWMSHPAWPSTAWQLYTSDYDTNAAYFGAMKACEPLHVQLNLDDRQIVVCNTTLNTAVKLSVEAELFDLAAHSLGKQSVTLDIAANATTSAFILDEKPAANSPLYFVKLKLSDSSGTVFSDNFYWQAKGSAQLQEFNKLAQVQLKGSARLASAGTIELELHNDSTTPALMIRPTVRTPSGDRILPAYASDGYFSLLPGESRHVTIQVPRADSSALKLSCEGWNLSPFSIPVQ